MPARPDASPATDLLLQAARGEFLAAALVDRPCGAVLTPDGTSDPRVEAEALASAGLLDAALRFTGWVAPGDEVLEIRVSMASRVHHIRPMDPEGTMFLYIAFDKAKGQFFDSARKRIELIERAFGL